MLGGDPGPVAWVVAGGEAGPLDQPGGGHLDLAVPGPFDFEALTTGQFLAEFRLRNFEFWQLGLLGLAVRDLCLGRIRIGYGKSRGFGNVSAKLEKLELRSITETGIQAVGDGIQILGVGALLDEAERNQYGAEAPDQSEVTIRTALKPSPELIGSTVSFERQAGADGWCAPEAGDLFGQCIKISWGGYRKRSAA